MWKQWGIRLGIAGVAIGLAVSGVATNSGTSCTITESSTATLSKQLGEPGTTVCLSAGTYTGPLILAASPSSQSTLTAAPGAHVVVTEGIDIRGSHLTVSQLHSESTIEIGAGVFPLLGFENDVIEHNDIGPTNGDGVAIFSESTTPSSHLRIAYNKIHNTTATEGGSDGDAIRMDAWSHVEVIANDIYEIKECPGGACHTDTLQSFQGEVPTEGLLIERNYIHDMSEAQGLPFLSDGDVANVTIKDNLAVRMSSGGQTTGMFINENTANLVVENNTYWETSGSAIQANGLAASPTATISHNVQDRLNVRAGTHATYVCTEDYDILKVAPFALEGCNGTSTIGTHSEVNASPPFKNPSVDDYRLSPNPRHIGVDWAPAEVQYGPSS